MIDEKIAKKLLPKAADIATKVMRMIGDEAHDSTDNDDFREGVYLMTNIMANLVAQTCLSLTGFCKSYGIAELDENSFYGTIKTIIDMRLEQNKEYINHIKELVDADKPKISIDGNLSETATH